MPAAGENPCRKTTAAKRTLRGGRFLPEMNRPRRLLDSLMRGAQIMTGGRFISPQGKIHSPAGCYSSYPTSFQNSMRRSGMEAFCSGVRYSQRNFSVRGLASCTWTNNQGLSALMMR